MVDGHVVKKSNLYDLEGGERSVWDQELGVEGGLAKASKFDACEAARVVVPRKPVEKKAEFHKEKKTKKKRDTATESTAELMATAQVVKKARAAARPRRARFLLANADTLRPLGADLTWCAEVADPGPREVVAPFEATPPYVRAVMRPYQLEGLRFLAQARADGMSAILGDEMGLGKTLQTLAFLRSLKEAGASSTAPSLVVCPLSVLSSWLSEAAKFVPDLRVLKLHSADTAERQRLKERLKSCGTYDLVVTTFEMAKSPSMASVLGRSVWWQYVVVDEGHVLKNEDSEISRALRKMHFEQCILLTGTPLQNDLHELWALVNFVFPDVFPHSDEFDRAFHRAEGKKRGAEAAAHATVLGEAHAMLGVLMLRRVKTQVEKTLPPKLETKIMCPLAEAQRWWYRRLLARQSALLESLVERDASAAGCVAATGAWKKLQSLAMQLRKCCNHPYLFEGADPTPGVTDEALVAASGKLEVLDRLLHKLHKRGHRVVLFSQFTHTLDLLDDVLCFRGYDFARLDGSTNRVQRTVDIAAFNADQSKLFVFLMSTRAGGLGVNLQTADTCILFDSDWNPQADLQAMARVHRIGQTKPVHVYRLVTKGTVEERIVARAENKLYLDSMVNRDAERDDPGTTTTDDQTTPDVEPSASELLAALRFGAAAVVDDRAAQQLSDADLEVIVDRTRTADATLGCVTGGAQHDAASFESLKPESLRHFEGVVYDRQRPADALDNAAKVKNAPTAAAAATVIVDDDDDGTAAAAEETSSSLADLALEFKRSRNQRTREEHVAGVGKVRVLVAEYGDGEARTKATPRTTTGGGAVDDPAVALEREAVAKWEAKAAKAALEALGHRQVAGRDYDHEGTCLVCGDGGLLLCCDLCPTSWHEDCLADINFPGPFGKRFNWACPHHSCRECSRKSSAAGGLLFRCLSCPNAYCEDHLDPESTVVGKCERFAALGQHHPKQACFVACSEVCVDAALATGDVDASRSRGATAKAISAAAGLDTTSALPQKKKKNKKKTNGADTEGEAEPSKKAKKPKTTTKKTTDERADWERLTEETRHALSVVLRQRRFTVGESSPHFEARATAPGRPTGVPSALEGLCTVLEVALVDPSSSSDDEGRAVARSLAGWRGVEAPPSKKVRDLREAAAALYLKIIRDLETWRTYELDALIWALQFGHLVSSNTNGSKSKTSCFLREGAPRGGLHAKREAIALYLVAPRQPSLWFLPTSPDQEAVIAASSPTAAEDDVAAATTSIIIVRGQVTLSLAPKRLVRALVPRLNHLRHLDVAATQTYGNEGPLSPTHSRFGKQTVPRVPDEEPPKVIVLAAAEAAAVVEAAVAPPRATTTTTTTTKSPSSASKKRSSPPSSTSSASSSAKKKKLPSPNTEQQQPEASPAAKRADGGAESRREGEARQTPVSDLVAS